MTKLSKSQKIITVGITVAIVLMLAFSHPAVYATNNSGGLKVNVFVSNAGCVAGENAEVRATSNGNSISKNVIASDNFKTQLVFGPGEVQNGDNVNVRVTINGQTQKTSVTNGEQKAPEDAFIDWGCSGNGNDSGDSSSSSSSSAAASSSSDNTNTNTAVATSSLCLIFCGDDQQNKDNSLSNSNGDGENN